ncbi:MAG: hypothetical protein U1D06_03135 [Paracoccaceae bacterium]|nr:hypothetical protein [Paracoccaceae bacterium]
MAFLRPEAIAALRRWREVALAAGLAALGLRGMLAGGYVLLPAGALLVALGVGLGLLALRRLRFAQDGDAPGVVEVDEGQISYYGPASGGFVALPDLAELRLITLHGARFWRLKQADGQALLIPVSANGAERLFDAFAALPGMDTQALVAALAVASVSTAGGRAVMLAGDTTMIGPVIWRRPARAVLT